MSYFPVPQKNEDAVAGDLDPGVPVLAVRNDFAASKTTTDGDYSALAVDAAGRVGIADLGGAITVDGDVADDTSDSGPPIKIGGVARTTNRTAVGNGDRVNLSADDLGRLVVVPQQVRDLTVHQHTTITSDVSETTILNAGSSGVFHDIVSIILTNSSATGTLVTIKDSTTGTTRLTLYLPANDTRGVVFQVPLTQATAANNWTATCGTSVASVLITVQAVKNV